ncbi:protein of unknown function [Rhizobium sp. RU35A]|nr:protein of unknown function [Rhizobium sp. RU35A]
MGFRRAAFLPAPFGCRQFFAGSWLAPLDPAAIPAYIGTMQDDAAPQEMTEEGVTGEAPLAKPARASRRGWIVAASLLLHFAILLPFLIQLPSSPLQTPPEESVSVEIVPPPEPPEPEPPKPDPPKPDPPQPEPPKPEPPPETKPEAQQPVSPPVPTLRPVFRFGEEAAGPQQSVEGNSADGDKAPAEEAPKPETQAKPEPAPQPAEAEATPPMPEPEPAPDAAQPPAPPVLSAQANAEEGAAPEEDGAPQITLLSKVAVPQPRPVAPTQTATAEPKPVKRLYSTEKTGNAKASTAMAGIPRGDRAGQLCASELQAQLLHGSPSYLPELLPAFRLPAGTNVMNVPRGAFRARGAWYNVSFLCTLNADATEVEAFSYAVGGSIPRSEWRERGFPSF